MDTHTRSATHAGSWYVDNPTELNKELTNWLTPVQIESPKSAIAIISPHAGYTFCGDTAAYAYKQINPDPINTIIILGPSHVLCLNSCALSCFQAYQTPFGDIPLDKKVNEELQKTNLFGTMDRKSEEKEHSLEMQFPFIYKIMERKKKGSYGVVPVLVGSIPAAKQILYGNVLSKYLLDPSVLVIVSSDFCHWGKRFNYSPLTAKSKLPIYEQIMALDREALDIISHLRPDDFNDYLKRTHNTICGRNPISILLYAVEHAQRSQNITMECRFLKYSQSNKSMSLDNSSVSYAAGVLYR